MTISPELDKKIAEMIRNHPAQKQAAAIAAQAKATIARTNSAIEAGAQIRPSQETLDAVAQSSARAKAIAAESNERLARIQAATASAASIKIKL